MTTSRPFAEKLDALMERQPQQSLRLRGSDQVPVTTAGTCPHCGNSDPDIFHDNDDDEFAWCYACRSHSLNPRWKGHTT